MTAAGNTASGDARSSGTASAIDLIRARGRRGGGPPFDDGASVALVVEGGAMRGVISAGMVSALEVLRLTGCFDAVYGSSAGAINAAYFLAGQARLGTTIYFEDINNRQFIDIGRALRGQPIVDLGFLLDDVARRRKRLDVERAINGPPLTVIATDVDLQHAVALGPLREPADLFAALRASATMPVLAGAPWPHQGRRFLDASLTEPVPVPTAEGDGHTHIVALLTRGAGLTPRTSAFDRWFIEPRLRRLSPALAQKYLARAEPYAELMRRLESGRGPLGRAAVSLIRVEDCWISKLERRRQVLEHGARRGYEAVLAAFAE
jgi:predicted patatin/cPLA2 family phospholipase